MNPLTESEIRASFVNCSKGAAKRINLPRDLSERPWGDLDYLGWRDPQAPERGYLVAEHGDGVTGLVLRAPQTGVGARRSMCSLCHTVQSGGVSLMVAPRAGRAGQGGHSVGTYICDNLACSLYVRGKLATNSATMHETLSVDDKVVRLVANLDAFVARALRQ